MSNLNDVDILGLNKIVDFLQVKEGIYSYEAGGGTYVENVDLVLIHMDEVSCLEFSFARSWQERTIDVLEGRVPVEHFQIRHFVLKFDKEWTIVKMTQTMGHLYGTISKFDLNVEKLNYYIELINKAIEEGVL